MIYDSTKRRVARTRLLIQMSSCTLMTNSRLANKLIMYSCMYVFVNPNVAMNNNRQYDALFSININKI